MSAPRNRSRAFHAGAMVAMLLTTRFWMLVIALLGPQVCRGQERWERHVTIYESHRLGVAQAPSAAPVRDEARPSIEQRSPWALELHGLFTKHDSSHTRDRDGNEAQRWNEGVLGNIGAGVRYELLSWLDGIAGGFRNSYFKPSSYFGLAVHVDAWGWQFGIEALGLTGYRRDGAEHRLVQPAGDLYVITPALVRGVHLIARYAPRVAVRGRESDAVGSLSALIRF